MRNSGKIKLAKALMDIESTPVIGSKIKSIPRKKSISFTDKQRQKI